MNRLTGICILALICLSGFGRAASADVSLNLGDAGLLIHGYDPVSYFDGEPQPGDSALVAEHGGARIYFSSADNLARFQSAPARYMPAYGGYCSYGVRMGQKFDIDPLAYHVSGDQLYLLLDRSTKALWDKNRDHNIGIADRIWNTIRHVPASTLTSSQQ